VDIPSLYTPQDMTSGHGPWPPVGYPPPPKGASGDVFINGKSVHRVGDQTLPHFYIQLLVPPPDIHVDNISTGSKSVYVNKQPMAIIGSQLTCQYGPAGQVAAFGANSVFLDSKK